MNNQQKQTNFVPPHAGADRPSLPDVLAYSALQRAVCAVSRQCERIYCIDATAGNGHDTCFLAGLGKALQQDVRVLACDVQEQALVNTAERLKQCGLEAELILCGHEKILEYLPQDVLLAGAVFNLGYLPGKERKENFIATKAETSLEALEKICMRLVPQGCISVHCYTGHKGGLEEYRAVSGFVSRLEPKLWRVLCVSDMNREHHLEHLFVLEKLQIRKRGNHDQSNCKKFI